ncbi:MAG TPA: peptidyl-alpha-hydroxyglycine alpha-amidating lyase family protein [Burkholderiales bacterium]|nr:peptidyl-alpha-hydroxyglycine alpha-amidating lyase family protein [Burkholderiales bacterium]
MRHVYRMIVGLAAATVVAAMLSQHAYAQDNPYRIEEGWGTLPDGRKWGGTIGVDIDRNSNIWVFERCGASNCEGSSLPPIIQLDPSGKVLRMFGAGMFNQPHGFHVDRDGNVWASDATGKDGKGHQVFKFSPEGKVLMTLGKAGVAGDGPDTFNRPCDVVTAPNGDIFVADGHGGDSNARIVKFSKDGKFIKAWGKKGSAPGEFDTPHAIAIDSKGSIFVGDRANNRIQIFDQDGKFLQEWKQFGRPSGLFIDRNDILYVADHQSDAKNNPGVRPGIRIGSVKDGKVIAFVPALGPAEKPTSATEGIAADAAGNLYAGETGTRNLRKYVKK